VELPDPPQGLGIPRLARKARPGQPIGLVAGEAEELASLPRDLREPEERRSVEVAEKGAPCRSDEEVVRTLGEDDNARLEVANVPNDPVEEFFCRREPGEEVGLIDQEELWTGLFRKTTVRPIQDVRQVERELFLGDAPEIDRDRLVAELNGRRTVEGAQRTRPEDLEKGRQPPSDPRRVTTSR